MYKKSLMVFFASFVSVISVFGQKKLSLQECVDYALQNHLSNVISNNDILAAKQKEKEALASYLPQVNSNIAFDDNLKRQVSVIPAGAFSPNEIRVRFGNQFLTNASVQLDQVIFDKTMLLGIQAAEPNTKLANLKKDQTEESLIYNTAASYFQVLVYIEQEKLMLENEKKYADLLNILKLRLEKGVIKKTDVDRTQATYNNILSQKSIIQANKNVALNRLKNVIGMTSDEQISVSDEIDYIYLSKMKGFEDFNPSNITDYKIQNQNIILQDLDVKRKQAAYLPTVSAYGRYGIQSFGNDFTKSFGNWLDYSSIGLKASIPIFSGYRKNSQLKQSEISLMNAQTNLKLSTQNMKMAYENASYMLEKSRQDLKINHENLAFAKTIFEASSFEYQKGVSMLSDLLNAEYSYKEAQSNYINSMINFLSSRLEYEKSIGNLKNYINQF